MAKHWKSYIEKPSEIEETIKPLPKSLEEVAKHSSSFKELLDEKERLEKELKSFTSNSKTSSSRYPDPQIISIDEKRKLETKWDHTRKKIKKRTGIVNEINRKKNKQEGFVINKSSFDLDTNKKNTPKKKVKEKKVIKETFILFEKVKPIKKVEKGLNVFDKQTNNIERFDNSIKTIKKRTYQFKNKLDKGVREAKSIASKNGLEIEPLNQISKKLEKVSDKMNKTENSYNKIKEKIEPIAKFKKKTKSFLNAESKNKKHKQKKDNGFEISVGDVKTAIDSYKSIKTAKDNWMENRDKKRIKSKKTEGFTV